MPNIRFLRLPVLLLSIVAVVGGLIAGGFLYRMQKTPVVAQGQVISSAQGAPAIGGRFSLADSLGNKVTEKSLENGKYHLIFFGFTNCPDICPGMLSTMAGVYEKLPPEAQSKLQMVFVSVDPKRDTENKLHEFVTGFHPSFIGWRGTPQEVEAMTKNYLAYAVPRPDNAAPDGYTIDHSTLLYLMGPDGKYVTHLRNSDSATSITERLQQLVK